MTTADDDPVPSDEAIGIVVRAHGLGFDIGRVAACLGLSEKQIGQLDKYLATRSPTEITPAAPKGR